MKPATIALGLAAIAGFAVIAHAKASSSNTEFESEADAGDGDGAQTLWAGFDLIGQATDLHEVQAVNNAISDPDAQTQIEAFLQMISESEGTASAPDPYRVCFGYDHTIADLGEHPAITGEWKGKSIAFLGADYAGKISTAAGRYQLIKPTWVMCRNALALRDFSAESQDRAAVYLIQKRGALDDVKAGRIVDAIDKCRDEWASLPGGTSGQPQRRLDVLLTAFSNAGGLIA